MAVLLNNRLHDWVSAKFNLGPPIGAYPLSVMAVTYPEHGSEKKLQWGTGKRPVGHTRDHYDVTTLEMEFLSSEWDSYRTLLGSGYGDVEIPAITFTYEDTAAGLTARTDSFLKCQVTKEQPSVSQGTDPLKTRVTFQPSEMILNGVPYLLPTTV